MWRLRWIGVWSALRTGCAFHFIIGLIGMGMFVFLWTLSGGNIFDAALARQFGFTVTPNILAVLFTLACVGAISGALLWGVLALLYNLAAFFTGGLELYIEEEGVRVLGIEESIPTPPGAPPDWRVRPEYQDYLRRQRELRRR